MPCHITLATSGAIILSDVSQLPRMMWPGVDAIEIGSLASEADLQTVLDAVQARRIAWGLHAPLWRAGPNRVPMAAAGLSADEKHHLRRDIARAASHGAAYALVHAPWFADHSLAIVDARWLSRHTVRFLADLGAEFQTPVALELKLGRNRDPGILAYLVPEPRAFLNLNPDGVTFCLDTGDWLLACEELGIDPLRSFEPFAPWTSVIHVHAVERGVQPYLWKPIHPSDPDAAAVRRLCLCAKAARSELTVVFEHTPHLDPGLSYDLEGYRWLLSALL